MKPNLLAMAQNDRHLHGNECWQLIWNWSVSGVNSHSARNMTHEVDRKRFDGWPSPTEMRRTNCTSPSIHKVHYLARTSVSRPLVSNTSMRAPIGMGIRDYCLGHSFSPPHLPSSGDAARVQKTN